MFRYSKIREKVCGDISLISSEALVYSGGFYFENSFTFKNILVALFNDFPSSGEKVQINGRLHIFV